MCLTTGEASALLVCRGLFKVQAGQVSLVSSAKQSRRPWSQQASSESGGSGIFRSSVPFIVSDRYITYPASGQQCAGEREVVVW
jgi:hypothetical protein